MKNKLLSLMLALIMMLGLLPIGAFAADDPYAGYTVVEVASQSDFEAAIVNAAAKTKIALADGNYTMPDMPDPLNPKDIAFTGSRDAKISTTKIVYPKNQSFTFDGVTVEFPANTDYIGFAHISNLIYKNCKLNGRQTLYSPEVVFENCIFENKSDYCIWTWGSSEITFTDCTFNTGGKAILVYNASTTSSFVATVNVTNCVFNDDDTLKENDGSNLKKAAIETGSDGGNTATSNKYIITINNCTANGFSANNSTSPLWGNKNNMDSTHLVVEIVTYVVNWVNYDNTPLDEQSVEAGEIPDYTGETPTKPADALYTYEFAGWTPKVGPATEDVTYTAVFEAIEKPKPAFPFIVTGVTQVKTIDAETEEALQGATFELYRISSTGSRKLHGTYTSNATGRITARTLSSRFTYELVMTEAPEGYDLLETPIIFRVQYNRPLQQVVPVTKTVVEEAPVEEPAA